MVDAHNQTLKSKVKMETFTTPAGKTIHLNRERAVAFLQSIRDEMEIENLHRDINKVYKNWNKSNQYEHEIINERIQQMNNTKIPLRMSDINVKNAVQCQKDILNA